MGHTRLAILPDLRAGSSAWTVLTTATCGDVSEMAKVIPKANDKTNDSSARPTPTTHASPSAKAGDCATES